MTEFWSGMVLLEQILFCLAMIATVALILQIILLLFGIGSADIEMDIGGADSAEWDGVGLFTIKGVIAFFAIGGWCGLGVSLGGGHWALSVFVALVCGAIALVGMGLLLRLAYKAQSQGNIVMENAVGKTAEVYLVIPKNGEGNGKINVVLQGRVVEAEAFTNADEAIKTGDFVKIIEYVGEKYLVEKAVFSHEEKKD